MPKALSPFADRLVLWQRQHGRHDLPWQNTRDPYRVWLSEIMLQQTQVATVMAYYTRFLQAFPDVQTLAAASLDDVLGLWSGLGYYSRARHLHACAKQVVEDFAGVFPSQSALLQTLKGIGPSTAAAIASLCFEERVAILDGNVKRVLTRHQGFAFDLSESKHEKKLWEVADRCLPQSRSDMPAYTQGIMDLGATLCTRAKPQCERCPVQADCVASARGDPTAFPVKTRKVKRSAESLWLLCATTVQGDVWLSQRPPTGIWAGLYTQPMFDNEDRLKGSLPEPWQWFEHTSGFHTRVDPQRLAYPRMPCVDTPAHRSGRGGLVRRERVARIGFASAGQKIVGARLIAVGFSLRRVPCGA